MRQLRDEAYVLSTHQLGEADVIVTLFAEHAGKVRGVARGARKSRRRFGGSLEPLTHVRAGWFEREGRDLGRIDSLEVVQTYAEMQSDPTRQAACAVLCELGAAVAREGQPDPRLFRLIGAVLGALQRGLHPLAAVRYFEIWTLKLQGVLPEPGCCSGCGASIAARARAWASATQGVLCGACRAAAEGVVRPLDPGARRVLETALREPPERLADVEAARRPGGGLELLLRGALRGFVERALKTYRHLDLALGHPAERGAGR